jgi:hypothetical protein
MIYSKSIDKFLKYMFCKIITEVINMSIDSGFQKACKDARDEGYVLAYDIINPKPSRVIKGD